MPVNRLIGIALLIIGAILLVLGMNASESFADRSSRFFTGHLTDRTMWYLILGLLSAITGAVALFTGGGKTAV